MLGIIEGFISTHNVMGLATSHDNIVRNTPVEYEYYEGAFWFLSEGGRKFDDFQSVFPTDPAD